MLRFSLGHARSVLVVLGLFAGTSGFFLKTLGGAREEMTVSPTDLACRPSPVRDPLCEAAMIDHLPGARDACWGKRASDGCDLVLPPMSIPGECAPGPGHSLYCAPRRSNAPSLTPDEREVREQSRSRW